VQSAQAIATPLVAAIFTPLLNSFNNAGPHFFSIGERQRLMGVIQPLFILLKAAIHDAHPSIVQRRANGADFRNWAKLISTEKWHIVSFLPVVVRYLSQIEYNARQNGQVAAGLKVWKISPDPNNNVQGFCFTNP
jgi:hypothetical protein